MRDATTDSRFGWTWLVPVDGARALRTVGLPEGDAGFLCERLELRPARPGERAAAWIVNADAPGARPSSSPEWLRAAQTVSVIGSARAVAPWRRVLARWFASVRDYGLLPARAPRLVVPLRRASDALAALDLHRPGRSAARIALDAARVGLRLRLTLPLRRTHLCIASRRPSRMPIGAVRSGIDGRFPSEEWDYPLYLGTAGPDRKTVVLPVRDGSSPVVVKIGDSPAAAAALRREFAALRAVRHSAVAGMTPRCDLEDRGDVVVLHEEYRRRVPVRAHVLERGVLEFLASLSRMGRERQPLHAALRAAGPIGNASAAGARLVRKLRLLAESGAEVWMHRVHGDFTPWNCAWTTSGLFVFDWEESDARGLAFSDAFRFALADAYVVGSRKSSAALARSALRLAERLAAAARLDGADLGVHFALWALRREVERPVPFYADLLGACERTCRIIGA